jgi:hypothetical protein
MRPIAGLFVVVLVCAGACGRGERVTQEGIRAKLADIDRATEKRDAATLCAMIAPGARITIRTDAVEGGRTIRLEPAEYCDYMKQGFEQAETYESVRSDVRIALSPDGKAAVVDDSVAEKAVVAGRTLDTVTAEKLTFEVRDGRLMLTAIDGQIRSNKP